MAVPNHHIHASQRRNFLRRALRIAAGEDHPRSRTRPPHAPQKGASTAVRLRRHAACVQNDNGCRLQTGSFLEPSPAQPGGNRLAIRPARPAPEVLNVIFFHVNQSINGPDAGLRASVDASV